MNGEFHGSNFVAQAFRSKLTYIQVKWIRPKGNIVKINMDGSYRRSNGVAWTIGILMNKRCYMIMAFAFPINHGSNNRAKTQAAFIGIKWCITNGLIDAILESYCFWLVYSKE